MLADKALFRSNPDGLQGKATKYAGKNAIQAVCNGCESSFQADPSADGSCGAPQCRRGEKLSCRPSGQPLSLIHISSGKPNKEKVATLTAAQVEEIAKTKMPDLNAASLEAACSMVRGTCRSMGIVVEG